MELQVCPHCGVCVIPSNDGICPSCRKSVSDAGAPSVPKSPGQLPVENPYAPPPAAASPATSTSAPKGKEPFSHQAAKFSAYAPFILLLMGMCLQGQVVAHEGTETGFQLAVALSALSITTAFAAFVLGFVGLVGGFSRRAAWTIILSMVGILLNGGLLSLWATALLAAFSRRA